jgi:protein involved in polysaccharide export with SLBB domain
MSIFLLPRRLAAIAAVGAASLLMAPAHEVRAQATGGTGAEAPSATGGPIRLRQPQAPQRGQEAAPRERTPAAESPDEQRLREFTPGAAEQPMQLPDAYRPSEFERYIQRVTNNRTIRRFGADLVADAARTTAQDGDGGSVVPPDYVVSIGDEVVVTIWGSVDADLRLPVDRSGRINIPRVGSIMVAGTRFAELAPIVQRQVARTFRNFELSVALGQLRGVRVFVTGFAAKPGAYSVSSLATASSVLLGRGGGPAANGSFRNVEVRRAGSAPLKLDLYQLFALGQREGDELLRAGDVIHVGPAGPQVALIGSVNREAIYELLPGETLADLLRVSGGVNAVADRSRVAVERLGERNDLRVRQLALPQDAGLALGAGDVVRVFSAIEATLALERQNRRVRVEGEVVRPGEYILPPQSSVADAIRVAGGLTASAYIFGTEFSRESVRKTQQQNFERALRDLELEMAKRSSSTGVRTSEEASAQSAQQGATDRLIQRLREQRPSGRIVLEIPPDARELPDLALEDGDRLYIPSLPTTVGLFGSVFNAGSYLFNRQRTVDDYLRLAGGPTRGADTSSVFVVRANGSVVSAQQSRSTFGWLGRSDSLGTQPIFAGDTVFVPEELNKTAFVQDAKDWTQILYQFGLGIAGIKAAGR